MRLVLRVLDANRTVRLETSGTDEIVMVFRQSYAEGDSIEVQVEAPGVRLVLAIDDALPPILVFLAGKSFALPIPFGPERKAYSPKPFSGDMHRLAVRCARPQEIGAFRNLALNPYDHYSNTTLFPQAQATAQTRGEAVFAPRSAIDGEKAAAGHGHWPYTSWGINRDPSAALTLTFGRPVKIDHVTLYLRADFPHDAWWRQASLTLSNGASKVLNLIKSGCGQTFDLRADNIEWVRLHAMLKADDTSPFPALTQLEVWGYDELL
ncbi:carbohydrate-binding protein [Devosia sp.]|uniref:carbohydrate-binding protein n=1 Tax=Devosia sp. TaxID=1871048 RepID=UPI003265ADEB